MRSGVTRPRTTAVTATSSPTLKQLPLAIPRVWRGLPASQGVANMRFSRGFIRILFSAGGATFYCRWGYDYHLQGRPAMTQGIRSKRSTKKSRKVPRLMHPERK